MKYYDRIKKLALPLYLVLLMLGFFFVKSVLKEDEIDIKEKKERKSHVEVKPVVVYLDVNYNGNTETYRARLENVDSVLDFFEYLVEEEDFTFSKEMHTYGIEYPSINGIKAPEGYRWSIFEDGVDITNMSHDKELMKDDQTYEARLTRISEPQ